ncbi:MAG: hypothetical protein ACJ783_07775 [Myxococcales bacterium]
MHQRDARRLVLPLLAILLLAGCGVRSISNSGYDGGASRQGYGAAASSNPFYRGELSEFDVLGIDRGKAVSEQEIQQAIDTRAAMSVKRGASVMLIQSGALIPDDPMVKALEKYYTVGVFSGVPPAAQTASSSDNAAETYARSLRLSAARGGYEKVVVYWGLLETAQENLVTRTVSWVPVVGWALPDQRQRMRIRLKMAVVDVRTGQWEMFSPEAFEDAAYSARVGRAGADQAQVWGLKDKAYVAAADDLVKRYGR